MVAELLKDLLLCAGFVWFLWIPLGRWLLHRIGKESLPDPHSLSMTLGMAAWGYLVLLLGLVRALYPSILVGMAVLLYGILKLHHLWARANSGSQRLPASPGAKLFIALFAILSFIYFGLVFSSALAPELAFDAINVHLPYARDAAARHEITFVANNWSSIMPALPLMSYVMAFMFSGPALAKLFNISCYVACGTIVFYFVRRSWTWLHAAAAALIFWSSPIALYEATTALIDLPLTLYSGLAVFSLLEWTRRDELPFLWLSAAALGLALACKYHAIFWLAPFFVLVCWHGFQKRWGLGNTFRAAMKSAVIIAVLFLPWSVRAWFYTGNPVFPLANSIFQSAHFTPAMESAARAIYDSEGVGRSWQALVQLPWTVTFHPGPFRGTLGVLFFVGTTLVLLRRKTPQLRYGIVLAAAYFYTWALTAQEIRYLLPAAPVLSFLAAIGILGSNPQVATRRFKRIPVGVPVYAGSFLILAGAAMSFPSLYPRLTREWTYWHSYKSPFNYLLGREQAQDYMLRDIPSIYVYDFINEKLTSRDRVLLLNDASQFYSRVPTLYSFTVEGEQLLLQETEEEILRKLKESGITHILLNYNDVAPLPGVAPRPAVSFFLDRGFQEKHLDAIYSRNNVVLYRVRIS